MLKVLKNIYRRTGIDGAPQGTWLYFLNNFLEAKARQFRMSPHLVKPVYKSIVGEDLKVAFRITGGIGDHLIAARYIRDLLATTGNMKFDIYSSRPEMARWIFSSFESFHECYSEYHFWNQTHVYYPIAMWVSQFVMIYAGAKKALPKKEDSDRKFLQIYKNIDNACREMKVFITHHPFLDGFLARKIVFMGMNRYDFLQKMSGISYQGERFALSCDDSVLNKHGLAGRNYITIHNGYDSEFSVDGDKIVTNATKCYPHCEMLASLLRARFPQLAVVQLGIHTSQPIPGVCVDLINKTSIEETAGVLRHSLLHIDNESGLVHMAACLGVKSCVIFGPTSVEFFAYESNINIAPPFCGNCWWIKEDWMQNCPRDFGEPRCMSERKPEDVLERITPFLEKLPAISCPTAASVA